jgi:type I restriction enzyme R subunit
MSVPQNFEFLREYDQRIGRLARQAEGYVHTDPESCLFKLRLMIETMTRTLVQLQLPHLVSSDLGTMLQGLERSGDLSRRQADQLHAIRRDGNAAVHGELTPAPTAMRRLRDAHGISGWYCRMIRRGLKIKLDPFVPPEIPRSVGDRTREALLLFGGDEEVPKVCDQLVHELEALDRIASEAGEPLVDADSIMLVMAMELERLLSHPRLGLTGAEARENAEAQLDAVKHELDEREQRYAQQRAVLAEEVVGED